MNFDDNFMDFTSETFSKMRLVLEGAVALFEDDVCRSIACCVTPESHLLHVHSTT